MEYKIIADSCCDLTADLKNELYAETVPLSMLLDDEVFVDDDNLDITAYMNKMRSYQGKIGSSCPSPEMYKNAFLHAEHSFAVTLSKHLSGSYDSAMLGKSLAEAEGAKVHVVDSKSASAGEVLVVLKIRELIRQKIDLPKIISAVEQYINNMKTYFVLEDNSNLVKNGRLSRIAGKLISVLNIKLLMGSDGDGNIALYSHARGQNQVVEKLAETIEKSGKQTKDENMVIAHCNNQTLAEKLLNVVKSRYQFKNILIVPTRGLSSMYANDKGIIMAF